MALLLSIFSSPYFLLKILMYKRILRPKGWSWKGLPKKKKKKGGWSWPSQTWWVAHEAMLLLPRGLLSHKDNKGHVLLRIWGHPGPPIPLLNQSGQKSTPSWERTPHTILVLYHRSELDETNQKIMMMEVKTNYANGGGHLSWTWKIVAWIILWLHEIDSTCKCIRLH